MNCKTKFSDPKNNNDDDDDSKVIGRLERKSGDNNILFRPNGIYWIQQRKLLWETAILTDKRLESNRPDTTLVQKRSYEWILIDVEVLWDKNILKGSAGENTEVHGPNRANRRNVPSSNSCFHFCNWRTQDYFWLIRRLGGDIWRHQECAGDSAAWNSSCTEGNLLSLSCRQELRHGHHYPSKDLRVGEDLDLSNICNNMT